MAMVRIDRNLISAAVTWMVIIYLLTVLGGCGGGTSGTGLGDVAQTTYVGTVQDPQGLPLASVQIENQATGDATTTDTAGGFSLATAMVAGDVPFSVTTPTFTSQFTVEAVPPDAPQVSLSITIDEVQQSLTVDRFVVEAAIVGQCSSYFDNSDVILQSARAPNGITCVAKVMVYLDGKARGHIPVAVQRSACAPDSPWVTVATGETFSGVHQGVAQLGFTFQDSAATCRYRIVTPYNYKGYLPVVYEIETFSAQEFDSGWLGR